MRNRNLPLEGVVTSEGRREGLFRLERTGVSTAPMVSAAEAFLLGLEDKARTAASFPVDSPEWRTWCNVHQYLLRHGVLVEELADPDRDRALGMMEAALSERGYREARDIMKLNETLRELTGSGEEYGEWLYWVSVMGTPSVSGPWGFQVDGHHLNLNCVLVGDQVVLSPIFMGSEPVVAESGKYAGLRVFAEEEGDGLQLAQSLTTAQAASAIVGSETPDEIIVGAFHDNMRLDYEGIAGAELTPAQREQLLHLIEVYVGRLRHDHAEVKMAEVKAHLDETHFSWRGGREDDSVFYYRVHSPVVLIEFDHQAGIALDNDQANRNHIHTVVRTPNGNDYGKDLLRQHYEEAGGHHSDHSHPHDHH